MMHSAPVVGESRRVDVDFHPSSPLGHWPSVEATTAAPARTPSRRLHLAMLILSAVLLLLFPVLCLSGCQTGVGRAVGYAFSGVPAEVPQAYDLVETQYLRLSNQEVGDIQSGTATTEEGKARQRALLEDRLEAQRQTLQALKSLRDYSGASSDEEATAARQAALLRRLELLRTLTSSALKAVPPAGGGGK